MKSNKVSVDGVLLLDKALEISSNKCLQQVKQLYHAKKAGHAGTLDPLASGMLVVCFGQATKFLQYLINAGKTYEVEAQLGQTTSTGDAEGEVLLSRKVDLDSFNLDEIRGRFTGKTQQIPPMYSALKHKGQRLYALARKGQTVVRQAREIEIYNLSLHYLKHDRMRLYVSCSKGTYIRSLVEDIGEALGCGAYVSQLRRTRVAHFEADKMKRIDEINALSSAQRQKILAPMDIMLKDWPELILEAATVNKFKCGQRITVDSLPPSGMTKIYDENKQFLGVGDVIDRMNLIPKRLIN